MSLPSSEPPTGQAPAMGAVLAGGAGRRLGGAKATVDLGGRPLIAYAIQAAERAGLDPVVVAKASSELPPLSCRVLREPAEPQHPLSGIVAALAGAGERPVIALACDMPLVSPALLASLARAKGTAVVPVLGGRLQPLPGRYGPEALPALREALARLQPLRGAIESLGPRTIDEDELARYGDPRSLCFNVNTPADLEHARRMLASAAG